MLAYKTLLAGIIALASLAIWTVPTSAQVGNAEICNTRVGFSTHAQSHTISSVEGAQTFTTTGGFTLTAVKLPLWRADPDDADTTVTIRITGTTANSGALLVPDPSNTLVTQSFTITQTYSLAGVPTSSQSLDCEPESGVGTLFTFTTPVVLDGSETYAILTDGGGRTGVVLDNAPAYDNYSGGRYWFNGSVDSEGTPDDWDSYCTPCTPDGSDAGFAVFNDIATPPATPEDIDDWLEEYLELFNLNDSLGRIIFAAGVALAIIIMGILGGIKPIITLMIAGLFGFGITLAGIIPPFIILSVLAVFFVMGMIGWLILRDQGGME